MATTKTSTETKREITRRGDVIVVKEVEKTTTYAPGKEPSVKEVTRIQEYKGVEDLKKLPEDVRRQLEGPSRWEPTRSNTKLATKGNFAEDFLSEHNRYRKIHGVGPLKLSAELMQISQKRAEMLAEKDEMKSKSDQSYGENLSCLWSSNPDHVVQASDVVSAWYAEQKDYNYEEEPSDLKAGHFTQMIWESTKELGVAAAKSDSNRIYVVASYKPPGNYVGEFKDNVHPSGYLAKPSKGLFEINFGSSKSKLSKKSSKEDAMPPTKSSETSMSELNKECLACHNEIRKKHGVPPLKYSSELANYAQQWANELALRDRMEHRKEGKYGENLYCYKSTNPLAVATAAEACRSWYSEMQQYDFDSEPRSLAAGHFTQMVWKGTSEVGMGYAKSKTGLQIIVANYNPPGCHGRIQKLWGESKLIGQADSGAGMNIKPEVSSPNGSQGNAATNTNNATPTQLSPGHSQTSLQRNNPSTMPQRSPFAIQELLGLNETSNIDRKMSSGIASLGPTGFQNRVLPHLQNEGNFHHHMLAAGNLTSRMAYFNAQAAVAAAYNMNSMAAAAAARA